MANTEKDREKALDSALAQIERQFGKGSLMRLGDSERVPMEIIPTGSIALTVTLTEKACSFPVLLNMPYEVIATENGNSHTGCWNTKLGDTHIYVAFPDDVQNQVIPMPKKWFSGVDVEAL